MCLHLKINIIQPYVEEFWGSLHLNRMNWTVGDFNVNREQKAFWKAADHRITTLFKFHEKIV